MNAKRKGMPKNPAPRRWTPLAASLLVPLAAFLLYLDTLAPTVLPYDSGTLQTRAYVLGIGHPTGYPTFIMLGHLFTYLPFGDVAYRVNLSSAAYAAGAGLFAYLGGLRLVPNRRTWGGVLSAATGALAFAVGPTLWSQAVITEVYTLNILFVAATVWALLLWRGSGQDRHLLLAALLAGLAVTAHATSGLLLPSALLFILAARPRTLLRPALLAKAVGAGLLGLAPYLYLPIRASMNPPMNYGDASTAEGLLFILGGGNFRSQMFAFGPSELPERLALYRDLLNDQFSPFLLLAAAVGLIALVLRDRAALVLLGTLGLGSLAYALEYDIPDIEAYFLPSYLVAALLVAAGLGYAVAAIGGLVARRSPDHEHWEVPVILAPALLALALVVPETRAAADQSDNLASREVIESVVQETERDATILGGYNLAATQYMQYVEGRRTDLLLVTANENQLIERTRAALETGPTYLIQTEPRYIRRLEASGYSLEPLGESLYRIEPS